MIGDRYAIINLYFKKLLIFTDKLCIVILMHFSSVIMLKEWIGATFYIDCIRYYIMYTLLYYVPIL